jgi:hypothetical protein
VQLQTYNNNNVCDHVKYVGNYSSHECEIEVSNVTSEDSGRWGCDVQSFQIGAHATRVYRRFGPPWVMHHRLALNLDLTVKSPTSMECKFVLNIELS